MMKKNFIIDFALLKKLQITKTEAIILEQIFYCNNSQHYQYFHFSIKELARVCHISRTYIHKCLKNLMDKNLIFKDNKKYYVKELYKEVKEVCFNEAHSLKQTYAKKEKNMTRIILKNHSNCVKNDKNIIKNFQTQESLFDTQVSTFDTRIYNTNTRFSMSDNTHREDIWHEDFKQQSFCQENSKQDNADTALRLYDLKALLQKFLYSLHSDNKKPCYENYMLDSSYIEIFKEIMRNEIQEASKIQLEDSYKKKIHTDTLAQLNEFLQLLSQTGIFTIKSNKEAILQTIRYYIDNGIDIQQCIKYSTNNKLLWLCYPSKTYEMNEIGYKALRNVCNLCLKKIENVEQYIQEKHNNSNIITQEIKEKLQQRHNYEIMKLLQTHNKDIQRFIDYRKEKCRYMNNYAYKSLCLHLINMKSKNIDITEAINQSIERDYNWVFPPTHKNRQYTFYPNRFYPKTQKYGNKNINRKIA